MLKIFRKPLIFESLILLLIIAILSGYTTIELDEADEYIMEVKEVEVLVEEPVTTTESYWKSLGEYNLTAYCSCEKCCGKYAINRPLDSNGQPIVYTSIGTIAKAGRTIAVDPTYIPYGSQVRIGDTTYTAEDCGGAIKQNDIDIYFDNHQSALEFGRQKQEVFILITE